MSEPLSTHFGPPPFQFEPTQPGQSVPAYTLAFRCLATALITGGTFWLFSLWSEGALGSGRSTGLLWMLSALALMLYTWWSILRSRTRLDATALHQSWIWDKHMELRELAYCKLIRVRGLDWLIAPRLYTRSLLGKFAVFYAADPVLLADFERLVRELADFRRPS